MMATDAPRDPARRLKSLALLGTALVAGLYLFTGTQDWFALEILDGGSVVVPIPGTVAVPAQAAFGLATLALVAALALAGPGFRILFGLLSIVLAGCVMLGAFLALGDPVLAGSSVVSEHTAVSGTEAVAELVGAVTITWVPAASIASAVLGVLVGLGILVTAGRWPGAQRRYDTGTALRDEYGNPVDWDALSRGVDPTDDEPSQGDGGPAPSR